MKTNQKFRMPISLLIATLLAISLTAYSAVAAPNLTIVLNDTMDEGTPLVDNFTGASAILLDTMNNTVATATFPDNMTAQFDISNINPGDYFVEINGLVGDHLPTRIDSNTSDIMQTVGKALINSVIGDLSNPTYRIKVFPSGNPPIVDSSHQVVNYTTGMNETIYNFVIVPGNSSKIEIRSLDKSAELNNFSTSNVNHDGLSVPFQQWILGDSVDSAGAFIGNHGHLYDPSADTCSGCHTNLGVKPANFSDVTPTNGWCFRCHNGPTGPDSGFFDVRLGATPPPIKPHHGRTWNVSAGGQNANMSIQGMAFYPGIITVNVGDTINFTVKGNFHTISFLSGQAPPPDGSPTALSPSGSSMYDGTGFVSSGILPAGGNYAVTFTTPGIYAYTCLIHPGMQGIVIVNPTGTVYPFLQRGYNNQSIKDLTKDMAVGTKLANKAAQMITSSPGANNTTNWQTFIDVPLSEMAKVRLKQVNNSNVTGMTILNMTSPAIINATLNASGLVPNSGYVANIKIGTCKMPGSTVFTIGSFNADSNGDALLMADISVTPPSGIMNRGWIVEIDDGMNVEQPIACGNVVKHDASYMRFASSTLNITQGDNVMWTQLDPMEIHTVSFLATNQTVPPLLLPGFVINPDVAGPSGTGVYNGTGFVSSGILAPGASYNLTFTTPGMYKYECLIHDEMKMIGYINVSPKGP